MEFRGIPGTPYLILDSRSFDFAQDVFRWNDGVERAGAVTFL
jgi:hypothetical protein